MGHCQFNRSSGRATTTALTLSLVVLFVAQAWRLTSGFEHWTLESSRMAKVSRGDLVAVPIKLRDSAGQLDQRFGGRSADSTVNLVSFIYTRCESVCTALGSEFEQMQRRLSATADNQGLRLISVSIAPEEDTLDSLASYAKRYRADPAYWTVSAPLDNASATVFLKSIGVIAIPDGRGGYVHNGDIHLIDRQGVVRGVWSYEDWQLAFKAGTQLAGLTTTRE